MRHRVAVIGGDGIGPEVVLEALKVVAAAGVALDLVDYDLGARRYLATGEVLPDPVLDELRGHDAILLGAVGSPDVAPGVLERGLLLRLRFDLDLYVNVRPSLAPPVDLVVVRENTEGVYAGEGAPCAGARPTRWPPRARSTPAWAWSAASASPSSWLPPGPGDT